MPSRAARITLGYLAAAGLWIVASDALVERLVDSPALLAGVQTWKGIGFVLVTALCLYALLRAAPAPAVAAAEASERLRGALLGLTFLLLVALIVGFGSLVFEREEAAFRERQYRQQAAILKLMTGQVERWVAWHRMVAEALRHDQDLVAAVAAASRQGNAATQNRMLSHLAGFLSGGLWQDAAVHAADGRLLLPAGTSAAPDAGLLDTIRRAARGSEVVFHDMHAAADSPSGYRIHLLVPMAGAVLVLGVDPAATLFPMVAGWPVPSETSETLLVRQEGEEVVFMTPLRHSDAPPLSLRKLLSLPDLPAAQAVRHGDGVMEGVDYRGVAVLSAFRPVAGTNWHIVAKTDVDEVMAPLARQAKTILAIVLLAVGLTALFVMLIWRSQQAAFAVARAKSREERAALERHFDSLFGQARDIILLIDPDGRIVEANQAAATAYGYDREALCRRNIRELRAPQTLDDFERQFALADRPGGVQFETVHLRRDGSSFPVEVSSRAIDIQGRRYRQSFIRDISERRRQENEIARLNRAYATLSQTNAAIVHAVEPQALFARVCHIAVDTGGYLGAWIGMIDEAGKSLLPVASAGTLDDYLSGLRIGLEPAGERGPTALAVAGNQPYWCDDFEHDPVSAPWRERARPFGIRASAALPLRRRNHVVGALNLYSAEAGAFDERMRALLVEMADDLSFALENFDRERLRRQAEEAMRESEILFRSIVEQNVAAIFMIEDGRVRFANPRACEILGYPPGGLDGLAPLELVAEEEREQIAAMIGNVLSGRHEVVERDFVCLRRDGSRVRIGARAVRVSLDGKPMILGVAQDIGERLRAQEEIERYNRRLQQAMLATVEAVAAMVEMRDPYTSGHERRVGELAAALGAELGLNENTVTGLRMTGYVHDIGKISIPAEILSKPGRLTELEFEIIKGHPRSGYDILKKVEFPWPLPKVILQHHERMDGSGYPQRLKGDEILLEARILAVADVVESMASHRPYRAALGIDKALEEIEQNSGRFYDPAVAAACLRLFRDRGYSLPA